MRGGTHPSFPRVRDCEASRADLVRSALTHIDHLDLSNTKSINRHFRIAGQFVGDIVKSDGVAVDENCEIRVVRKRIPALLWRAPQSGWFRRLSRRGSPYHVQSHRPLCQSGASRRAYSLFPKRSAGCLGAITPRSHRVLSGEAECGMPTFPIAAVSMTRREMRARPADRRGALRARDDCSQK